MPYYLRSPEHSPEQDLIQAPTLDKGKGKQTSEAKDKPKEQTTLQDKETAIDNMGPKSGYYESSHSSSEGDRVHYDPRKERRSAPKPTTPTKRTTVVHNHNASSGEAKRPAHSDASRWK